MEHVLPILRFMLWLVFVPFVIITVIFVLSTYDGEKGGWYYTLIESKNPLKWTLFVVLTPFYIFCLFFLLPIIGVYERVWNGFE